MKSLLVLLAQTDFDHRFDRLRGAFRHVESQPQDYLVIPKLAGLICAVILVILLAMKIKRRTSGQAPSRKPWRLFAFALRRLGIGCADRVLMRWIARHAGFANPSALLLSPALLDEAARHWGEDVRFGPLNRFAARRVRHVSRQVFEDR